MSKASDFHPSLSTLDVAKFQLMENGFAGIVNGVTLIPAKDQRTIEANHLNALITTFLDQTHAEKAPTTVEALKLLVTCKAFLEQYPENPACAAVVVFRPSVREGEANVQPVARIIDPWEVVDPECAHTDGAGNVKEQDGEQTGGSDDNSSNPGGNKGNGAAH